MALQYPGRIPSNVNKDAKYSVVSARHGGGMEVRLVYTISAGIRELLTTDRHDALVDMINRVKIDEQGQPGGVFYINEYRDVLVKAGDGCFYAGNYPFPLEFDFEGQVLGPRAPHDLQPGDQWSGPHVGIRYVLTADGSDIKYEAATAPTRTRTELLSAHVGSGPARQLAQRLGQHKGRGGGRLYVNEVCEFFSPVQRGNNTEYMYLGALDDDAWFRAPDVPRPED
jgi:hypothetical protein